MSEVEKMYENAGIEKVYEYVGHYPKTDENGIILPMIYPPFTAEKQLELIKLLSYYYNITISKNFENDYTFQCQGDDVRRYVFTSGQNFAEQILDMFDIEEINK